MDASDFTGSAILAGEEGRGERRSNFRAAGAGPRGGIEVQPGRGRRAVPDYRHQRRGARVGHVRRRGAGAGGGPQKATGAVVDPHRARRRHYPRLSATNKHTH